MGFRGVCFDKDNTLTEPYKDDVYEPYKKSIDLCLEVFGRDKVAIISNSAGSSDDTDFKKAQQIESSLGMHVIRHGTKKPDGIDQVSAHFNTTPDRLIMVGDRYLTDILFGNLYGMLTIFTKPITSNGDNPMVKLIRNKEHQFVQYSKQFYQPPLQPLFKPGIYFKK
ncbi:hypothetical protein DFA_01280 [Cavenderia fasciculata]|uniref:Uncharacterized protein n=1 Tax=Cavenderia fasciculata TaxID=261658 RepID=F4PRW2_CACFS|nr:uncharacterized protein DFA_01280 [Cavenderia fasciculata]EGG21398.1 hypothetical protein DFA_01280 [Cavenderia fasciculata]|eukprot:XP_004359248.1 hypothetical protein DFA_01280 [Cavenderia fasciculata]